jgi:hypothetical protein
MKYSRVLFVLFVLMLLKWYIALDVVAAYEGARVLWKLILETSKQESSWYDQLGMGV